MLGLTTVAVVLMVLPLVLHSLQRKIADGGLGKFFGENLPIFSV